MSYPDPPPPPPGYPPGGYGGAPGYPVAPTNPKATWAMILGILGLVCCGIAAIPALVLGIVAKNEIQASNGMQSGAGQAQAGFILGIIGCALWVVGVIAYVGLASAGGMFNNT